MKPSGSSHSERQQLVKGRNSKRPSRTDWKRIDALRDEDIDFSDAPELGPDFFKDKSWGFGLAVQNDGSYGWAGGFGSTWLMDPGHDLTVLMLTQRMFAGPEPEPLHTDFQAAAYQALA